MAPMTAVLETYELLENIISQLPARDVLYVVRVSKAWKKVACSARIEKQNSLAPLHNVVFRRNGYNSHPDGADCPIYPHQAQLRFHPQLSPYSEDNGFSLYSYDGALINYPRTGYKPLDLRNWSNGFISSPPIQAMRLDLKGWSGRQYSSCVIYMKHGIRIKDVLNVAGDLLEPSSHWQQSIPCRILIQSEESGTESEETEF